MGEPRSRQLQMGCGPQASEWLGIRGTSLDAGTDRCQCLRAHEKEKEP